MKKLMLNLMLCLSLVLTGLVIPSVEVNAANEVPVATIDNVSIIADDNDTLGCIIGVDATQATTKDLTTEMVEAIDNYVQTNSLSEVEIFLVDVLSIPDNAFRNKSYLTGVNISADNGSTVTIGDNAFEGCTSLEWVMTFDAFSLTLGDECFKDIADYVTLSDFGKLSDLTLGTNVFLNIGSGVEISSTGGVYQKAGSSFYTGLLYAQNGLVQSSANTIGTTTVGNPQYILSSARFSSVLIKDTTGSIIGIYFQQIE